MKSPNLHLDQFAFRETVTFDKDNPWPNGIWNALARASGVRARVRSVDSLPHHPQRLTGSFEVGANVMAIRSYPGSPQVLALSFAAFRPKDRAIVGWSYDHTGESSEPTCFSGDAVLDVAWLRKLQREGKALRERGEARMQHDADVTSIAFSSDGERLVSLGNDHHLRIWDVATGEPVWKAKLHKFAHGLAVGTKRVLVGGGPMTRAYDLAKGAPGPKLESKFALESVALVDDTYALSGHDAVGLWNLATGKQSKRSKPTDGYVVDVGASGDTIVAIDRSHVRELGRDLTEKNALAVKRATRCAATKHGVFVWTREGRDSVLSKVDFARGKAHPIAHGERVDLAPDGSLALVCAKKWSAIATATGKTIATIDARATASAKDPNARRVALVEGAAIRFVAI